ncbi:MAG: class II glutamine amidotransferase [Candidatus Bathyarchaeia archaeon]
MCRLFGMVSTKPSNAVRYLLSDPCSLYAQSRADPLRLQGDGWGLGFYEDGCLRVFRSERPIYEEYYCFKSIVEGVKSNIIVAHVRRASNPRGLPRERLISIENIQPFSYESYLFAHNGTITIPDEVSNMLGEWRFKIRGLNDSEVYFWYIVKEICEGRSLKEALRNFEEDLWRVWREVRERHPNKNRPYIGLNIVFSDGVCLYAYCKYDENLDGSMRTLCYRDSPAMRMVYVADGDRLIVASERTNDDEDWRPLRSGQLIIGRIEGDAVKVSIEDV